MELGSILVKKETQDGRLVTVRTVSWEDLDDLHAFANDLISEDTFVMLSGKELTREEEIDYLADAVSKVTKGELIHLIATIDGKFAGSCQIRRFDRRKHHVGEIGISVAKRYRSSGVGSIMFETLIAEGKKLGLRLLTLTCFSDNKSAIGLYEKFGFVRVGTIPHSYKYKGAYHGETIMYKELV